MPAARTGPPRKTTVVEHEARSPGPAAAPGRVLMKGNEAIAEAAIQAGCDAYFGYPITPQCEILEWMARRMPEEGRAFVQAESELGAINMALGAASTGARAMTSTSSPGFSLMGEAMSYMAGSEVPVVLVNVMRGGPGLGSIGPAQSDYLQATRGHGHGDYRVPVLAPSSINEAVELVADAFELAERYRTPTIVLTDGIMGQAMEPMDWRFRYPERRPGSWALTGARDREPRTLKSIHLDLGGLEEHNRHLQQKFATIAARETRWAGEKLRDAEVAIVAYGTAARVARTAIARARDAGLRAGLFRPITLWPFPEAALRETAGRLRAVVVVELAAGQLIEDVRLAVEGRVPVFHLGRTGGMVPTPQEVVDLLRRAWSLTEPGGREPDEEDPFGLLHEAGWIVDETAPGGVPVAGAAAGGAVSAPTREPDPFSLLEDGFRPDAPSTRRAVGRAPVPDPLATIEPGFWAAWAGIPVDEPPLEVEPDPLSLIEGAGWANWEAEWLALAQDGDAPPDEADWERFVHRSRTRDRLEPFVESREGGAR